MLIVTTIFIVMVYDGEQNMFDRFWRWLLFMMIIVYDDDDDDEPGYVVDFFALTHRGCLAQDIMPWLQQHLGEAKQGGDLLVHPQGLVSGTHTPIMIGLSI